jgi:hypothetical protein
MQTRISTLTRTLPALLVLAAYLAHAAPPALLSGQGGCPAKNPIGSLRIASGPQAGSAAVALSAVPGMAQTHALAAAGEPDWLRALSGTAGPNREYQERGRKVLVVTACATPACDGSRAYVAFDRTNGDWGATVVEGRHLRDVFRDAGNTTLAMHPDLIGAALQCAMGVDRPATPTPTTR